MEPAETSLKVLDVKTVPNLSVGYIVGVGDQVPAAIEQLGARVTFIEPDELAWGDLSKYDAIITGVRAYERRADLRAYNRRLLDYANNGGTVIVQYNKMEFNQAEYGPYPAKVSGNRVADETVPVKILVPEDPVFNYPEQDRSCCLGRMGPGARSVFPRRKRQALHRSGFDDRFVQRQSRRKTRFTRRSQNGQGPLDLSRAWVVAAIAGRHRRRLPAARQSHQFGQCPIGKEREPPWRLDELDPVSLTRFAPEYTDCVLNENFEDAKSLFLVPLMSIHYAHLVMLAARGIVSPADAHAIREALDAISLDQVRCTAYDGQCEDLYFYVERLIVAHCGEERAGRLHIARSRNDIDMTMYRMRQREFLLGLLRANFELRRTLLELAARHRETIFAAHTHTQRAQPTTIAHYLLAVAEQLERDAARLIAAYQRTNVNPLGACAITGTGFPIDRQMTSDLLGFFGPTVNTYGSIATVDYLLESVSAAAVLLTGHGRFVQDLLLWSTAEFGYMRLGDGFVQSSSIMPQKRNPVALEHARAIGSKALGQALAIVTTVHNTPFGDIVDTEDDLQPLVHSMFHDATRTVKLVAAAMRTAEFEAATLEAHAGDGWTTLTELADTLVRLNGLSFKAAHAIAARLAAARTSRPDQPLAGLLAEVSAELLGVPVLYGENDLATILSPRHFVAVRRTLGGPAPEETARALAVSYQQLQADEIWWFDAGNALGQAEGVLRERSAAL